MFKAYSFIILLISAILLSSSLSFASTDAISYIVGGEDADREYPWVVALYASDDFTCGGVVISSHWIATAAHCVYQNDDREGNATAYDASYFNVVIGQSTHYSTTDIASAAGVTVYEINNVIINSDYDSSTVDSDIALLELSSSYYQPGPAIATADRFDSLDEGDLLTVIGYGVMSVDEDDSVDETIPDTLQEVELPFVPTNACYWGDNVTDNMFCAGYEDSDTDADSCSGDSGGPIFTTIDGELTLLGLVSWGSSDCSDVPGVYTNVSNLRSWIMENIDGYQVVEEGTASYNSDTGSYSSGLISVYNYGSETDEDLTIGSLTIDDDYSDVLSVSDNCSSSYLSSSDGSCTIDFDLLGEIDDDDLFEATLSVTPTTGASEQTYDLRFVTDATTVDGDSSSSSSSGGGSFSFISLFFLALLGCWKNRPYKTKRDSVSLS